jgi:hypothetical protein
MNCCVNTGTTHTAPYMYLKLEDTADHRRVTRRICQSRCPMSLMQLAADTRRQETGKVYLFIIFCKCSVGDTRHFGADPDPRIRTSD